MKGARRALISLVLCSLAARAGAESFASWSSKGQKAEKRGDSAEAVEDYSNALRMWKESEGKKAKAKVLAARAWLLAGTGSLDAALKDLKQAAKLDDKSSLTSFRKGRVELDQGKTSDAISDFYKATKLNLNYGEAYYYRGLAYEAQGDKKFAKEDFKTACRLKYASACPAASRGKTPEAEGGGSGTGSEPVKHRKKPSYRLDWPGCLASLNACVDAGGAFGDCVKQAKECESSSDKGCCPHACVKHYIDLVNQGTKDSPEGMSEAAAYRTVFTEEIPSCAKQ